MSADQSQGALADRVALVTGAGSPSGIGVAVARTLLADGATTILVGLTARIHQRAEELAEEHGAGRVEAAQVDLTDPVAIDELVAGIVQRHGRLDIVVNNAAMIGLTRAVALETASQGITVNAVAPGWIATGSQTPWEAEAGRMSPVGRSGTPDEVAAVIRFLVDPAASYLTGQLLVVDGGNSIPEDRTWSPG